MRVTSQSAVTTKMSITSASSAFPLQLRPNRWRRMTLSILFILIAILYFLWDISNPAEEMYRPSIGTGEDVRANGKYARLSSYIPFYSYFDSRYQPISVNGQYEFYYEKSFAEHRLLSRKSPSSRASSIAEGSGRSTNDTDNADTPFMYPMLAPMYYVRYESSTSQSSTSGSPRFSSCSSLLRRDAHEYTTIIRDSINFYDYPKYNMPWYFYTNQESWMGSNGSHADVAVKEQTSSGIRNDGRGSDSVHNSSDGILMDIYNIIKGTSPPSTLSNDHVYHSTMPLCGRTLVRFLENPAPGVPKDFSYKKEKNYTRHLPQRSNGNASIPIPQPTDLFFSNATVWEEEEPIPMKAKSVEEYYKEPVEHQSSVHRVVVWGDNTQAVSKDDGDSCSAGRMGHASEQFARVIATASTFFSQRIYIENCGTSEWKEKDIFIHARLIGHDRVLAVEVVPVSTDEGSASPSTVASHLHYDVQFQVPDIPSSSPAEGGRCHPYYLEMKYVHINGKSPNPRKPYTLGIIGSRAPRGQYMYNIQCDFQRHVYGSPLLVVVVKGNATEKRSTNNGKVNGGDAVGVNCTQNVVNSSFLSSSAPPISVTDHRQCTRADHTEGQWVRFQHGSSRADALAASQWCQSEDNRRFCSGNPTWLTDAAGYNNGMLWAPTGCAYTYWTPPQGPTGSCVRHRGGSNGTILLAGDSLMREQTLQCEVFNLSNSNLECMYLNAVTRGWIYTKQYAKSVVDKIIEGVVRKKAAVFVTNLGVHHMIGPSSVAQWSELVDLFASEWENNVNRGVFRVSAPCNGTISGQKPNTSINTFIIEKAIWISSPTIHYGDRGLSYQRAVIFNQIALSRLRPLGFDYLNSFAPTYSRQEGSWDGLHYAAAKRDPQTHLMNPFVDMKENNGGVSSMLFTMLLNLICFG